MLMIDVPCEDWEYAEAFFQDPQNSCEAKLRRKDHGKVKYSFIRTNDGQIFALNKKKYLGLGGLGKVKLVQSKSGDNYVVKIIGDTGDQYALDLFLREKEIDEGLGYQVGFAQRQVKPTDFLDRRIVAKQYHFKRFFQGIELFESIDGDNPSVRKICDPLECIELSIRMLEAIQALHDKGIISLDVKFENFIVNFNHPSGHIVVYEVDHGFSRKSTETILTHPLGTGSYVAPEVLFDRQCSKKSDTYSLGVLFLGAKALHPSFDSIEEGIFNGLYVETAKYFKSKVGHPVFARTMTLLSAMKALKPDERPELLTIIAQLTELYNAMHLELGNKTLSKFSPVPSTGVDAGSVVEDIIPFAPPISTSSPPLLYGGGVPRESSLQPIAVPDSVARPTI
jgi:serine/threonine protein kinase